MKNLFLSSAISGVVAALCSLSVNAATGTAETLYSGTQSIETEAVNIDGITRYKLRGQSASGSIFETRSGGSYAYGQYGNGSEIFDANNDNYWDGNIDDNSTSPYPLAALDVHWGIQKTLEFFANVLGVNSFDNNGGVVFGNAHAYRDGSWEYENGIISFSDALGNSDQNPWVSIDLVAHEIGHSMLDVISARPNIQSLPGILDEGFPDVVGIAVRHFAKPNTANFEFADEIFVNPGQSLRSLSNPTVNTYGSNAWNMYTGKYDRAGLLGKWFYLASAGGNGTNDLGQNYSVNGVGTEDTMKALYDAFDLVSGDVSVEDLASATVEAAQGLGESQAQAMSDAWHAVGVSVSANSWQRTIIFIYGETDPGQDMFIRGGIDHGYANSVLGRNCQTTNFECAIPIQHNNLINATTSSWKQGDTYLDWYGAQNGQSWESEGTPLDWTTDFWPSSWGQERTVNVDGFGSTPLNTYGQHFWMLDVQMDCSATVNGWFEIKSFISNGPGWESDVSQPNTPYQSGNHFAECGKLNVFSRGQSYPVDITPIP